MTAPIITLRDGADVELVPPIIFADVLPGVASTPFEVRVYNDFDAVGTDPAERLYFHTVARKKADLVWLTTGLPALDQHSLQVRIIGSTANVNAPLTGFIGQGTGVRFDLPDLPSPTGGVFTEVRILLPQSADPDILEFAFEIERLLTLFVGEETPNGIVNGLGDSASLYLVSRGLPGLPAAVVPDSPVSDFVDFPDVTYVAAGLLRDVAAQLIQFDEFDGAAVALSAGEGYASLVSLGLSGLTVTKGLLTSLPVLDADRPDVPIGDFAWAFIERHEDGLIDAPKIVDVAVPGLFDASDDGLVLTIGSGIAHAGGFRIRKTTPTGIALAPNATNDVFLRGDDGTFIVTDGADINRPAGRPIHLWRAVTDGSTVTNLEDRRGTGAEVRGR